MKIIAIEGLDKSGKASQCKLLTDKLRKGGYLVEQSEFHRYDLPTGKLIMDWLTKKWDCDQYTIELIMTADKQSQQHWFNQLEVTKYDFLILDRYILSQAAYGVANGIDCKWIIELHKHMRYPDLDIVIDIPASVSMNRKGKHNNGANDKYESDYEMLSRVRDNFINMSEYYSAPIKKIVNGERDTLTINEDIYKIVKDMFGGSK